MHGLPPDSAGTIGLWWIKLVAGSTFLRSSELSLFPFLLPYDSAPWLIDYPACRVQSQNPWVPPLPHLAFLPSLLWPLPDNFPCHGLTAPPSLAWTLWQSSDSLDNHPLSSLPPAPSLKANTSALTCFSNIGFHFPLSSSHPISHWQASHMPLRPTGPCVESAHPMSGHRLQLVGYLSSLPWDSDFSGGGCTVLWSVSQCFPQCRECMFDDHKNSCHVCLDSLELNWGAHALPPYGSYNLTRILWDEGIITRLWIKKLKSVQPTEDHTIVWKCQNPEGSNSHGTHITRDYFLVGLVGTSLWAQH